LGHAHPGGSKTHPEHLRGHQQPLPGQSRRERPATPQHFEGDKTESARRPAPAVPATRANRQRNAGRPDTFYARFTIREKIEGHYFLNRFSNAWRASNGRPDEGASTGTCEIGRAHV